VWVATTPKATADRGLRGVAAEDYRVCKDGQARIDKGVQGVDYGDKAIIGEPDRPGVGMTKPQGEKFVSNGRGKRNSEKRLKH